MHVYEERIDEIEYLLSDPIHKEKILATIKEVEEYTNPKTYIMGNIMNMVNEKAM